MSDTYTTALKIRLPATGAYNNTWGAVLNSSALQLFDTSIAGLSQISIGSSVAYSMPAMSQGSDTPSRYFCIQFVGTPASAVTVTLPSTVSSKFYLVDNLATGQTLTFTYGPSISTASTVTVAVGEKRLIWCDGTNVWNISTLGATTLNGYASSNFARVLQTAAEIAAPTVVQNIYTQSGSVVTNVHPFTTLTLPGGSTITINAQAGDTQAITLTGNYTMGVPSNAIDGSQIDFFVLQDGTGGRLLSWNSVFLFQNGALPTLSTVGGGIDRFTMKYNGTLAKWLVSVAANITSPSGATYPLTIASNVVDWKLLPLLGSPGGPITVTVTVNTGVMVSASSSAEYAMDLSGLPSGSTVNLVNNGYIIGHGGDGADGAAANYPGSGGTIISAKVAKAGGGAILGPGLSRSFNVTNTNGHIWGGGGGGGGGGATDSTSGNGVGNAGGGGGGAGGGKGGRGGSLVYIAGGVAIAVDGGIGTAGYLGIGGAAGTGTNGGGGLFGAAGAGGTYGVAGSTGVAPATTITGHTGAFSAGGAAGKAIELQGAGAPTVGGSVLGLIS